MANIHRIGDYQRMPQQGEPQPQEVLPIFTNEILQNPRNENFWTMLHTSICPKFTFSSFTTAVCFGITALYWTMIFAGGVDSLKSFLQVEEITLIDFGANIPIRVKSNGYIFLWFSSIFLTPNFYNWVLSIFLIMFLYSGLENKVGIFTSIAIYIGGGASGALFGDLCNICSPKPLTEVYSSIYAVIGAIIGILILQKKAIDALLGPAFNLIICMLMMIFIMIVMVSLLGTEIYIDNFGKLGGLLGGSFIAMFLTQPSQNTTYEKNVAKIGLGLFLVFVGLNVILLFSLKC